MRNKIGSSVYSLNPTLNERMRRHRPRTPQPTATATNTEAMAEAQITNRYQINTVITHCFPKALTALQPHNPLIQLIFRLINQQLATTTDQQTVCVKSEMCCNARISVMSSGCRCWRDSLLPLTVLLVVVVS